MPEADVAAVVAFVVVVVTGSVVGCESPTVNVIPVADFAIPSPR